MRQNWDAEGLAFRNAELAFRSVDRDYRKNSVVDGWVFSVSNSVRGKGNSMSVRDSAKKWDAGNSAFSAAS